jgi:hypothetical protein
MNPKQFFAQLLQMTALFRMERVETKMSGTQIKEAILRITIASKYRLEGYEYSHSRHKRRWK